jgi:hypothetical protein
MIRWLALVVAAALILFGLCFFGIWIPNEPAEAKYPIRGIDVSHHQRDIKWDAVKDSGIGFAYIKATEGADFKDKKFQENWAHANAAGIARGAYHFFTLGTPGVSKPLTLSRRYRWWLTLCRPRLISNFPGGTRVTRSRERFSARIFCFLGRSPGALWHNAGRLHNQGFSETISRANAYRPIVDSRSHHQTVTTLDVLAI